MAGSLNHIVANNGGFSMDLIENLGDAHEALEECFHIIRELTRGDMKKVNSVCKKLGYPTIEHRMTKVKGVLASREEE
jgi:hypothetical protein